MKSKHAGSTLIEAITAVVILTVVGTATVATIAPLRGESREQLDRQNIADLNCIAQAYHMESGQWTDRDMTVLFTEGFTSTQTTPTPYGSYYYYQWDSENETVINPTAR